MTMYVVVRQTKTGNSDTLPQKRSKLYHFQGRQTTKYRCSYRLDKLRCHRGISLHLVLGIEPHVVRVMGSCKS